MISERMLRKWRREAIIAIRRIHEFPETKPYDIYDSTLARKRYVQDLDRVLQMTQELLDQHLLKKGGKK